MEIPQANKCLHTKLLENSAFFKLGKRLASLPTTSTSSVFFVLLIAGSRLLRSMYVYLSFGFVLTAPFKHRSISLTRDTCDDGRVQSLVVPVRIKEAAANLRRAIGACPPSWCNLLSQLQVPTQVLLALPLSFPSIGRSMARSWENPHKRSTPPSADQARAQKATFHQMMSGTSFFLRASWRAPRELPLLCPHHLLVLCHGLALATCHH